MSTNKKKSIQKSQCAKVDTIEEKQELPNNDQFLIETKKHPNYDSTDLFYLDKETKKTIGSGYINRLNHICLIRCPKCRTENYAMAVSSGICAWCSFDANGKKNE